MSYFDPNPPAFKELVNLRPPTTTTVDPTILPVGSIDVDTLLSLGVAFVVLIALIGLFVYICSRPSTSVGCVFFWDKVDDGIDAMDVPHATNDGGYSDDDGPFMA